MSSDLIQVFDGKSQIITALAPMCCLSPVAQEALNCFNFSEQALCLAWVGEY